jgi:hypothetical protein
LVLFASQEISSCQLSEFVSVNQRTAWFIEHRLRFIKASAFKVKLGNDTEMDETFLGGKNKNRH